MAQNKVLGYEVSDWSVIALIGGIVLIVVLILHEVNQLPQLAGQVSQSFWSGVFAPFTSLWNSITGSKPSSSSGILSP